MHFEITAVCVPRSLFPPSPPTSAIKGFRRTLRWKSALLVCPGMTIEMSENSQVVQRVVACVYCRNIVGHGDWRDRKVYYKTTTNRGKR